MTTLCIGCSHDPHATLACKERDFLGRLCRCMYHEMQTYSRRDPGDLRLGRKI